MKSVGVGHIQEILLERAVRSWLLMKVLETRHCAWDAVALGLLLGPGVLLCLISSWLEILDTSRSDLQGIVLTTDSTRGLYTHNIRVYP